MPRRSIRKDHGLLISWFEAVTGFLVKLSLGKKMEGTRPEGLDIYVLGWLTFIIVILIILAFIPLSGVVMTILIILFSYHLFEIAVTSFNSVIIAPIEKKKNSSVPRKFSLVLVNYVEVILVFTIFLNFVLDYEPILKSLQESVSLATLAGASIDTESNAVFLTSIFEMLFGIFFVTGIIASIANYIGSKEEQ
jgi:hypothetical protein